MTAAHSCTACGSTQVSVFMEIPRAPVFCNQLCHTREDALSAPTAEIRLGFCADCGHVFNTIFDAEPLKYSPEYENSLHFSPRFQGYADDLAGQLVQRYGLKDKNIIEIGCGRGDFLKSLCRNGGNQGFGFDPSYPDESGETDLKSNVTIFQEGYSEAHASLEVDLVCCRHCLEHIDDPRRFLNEIHKTIGTDSETAIFFEVPNVLFTLRDGGIWDIIYEHCSYFSPSSLGRVFESSGFGVIEVSETFEGQFLTIHALPGQDAYTPDSDWRLLNGLGNYVQNFANLYREKIESWKTYLQGAERTGQKIVVWGAGSKGNTFLNTVNSHGAIQYVVDINPRKYAKFVAGTGQEIVPPEFLFEYRPDAVIVMNSIYGDEIRKTTESLGLDVELLYA